MALLEVRNIGISFCGSAAVNEQPTIEKGQLYGLIDRMELEKQRYSICSLACISLIPVLFFWTEKI